MLGGWDGLVRELVGLVGGLLRGREGVSDDEGVFGFLRRRPGPFG